jgi:hypothetical protein
MSRLIRISILCTSSAFVLIIITFLVLMWRSRTADCVRNVVKFEVNTPSQSGAELVVVLAPADTYTSSPIRITLNGVRSSHEVLFSPFSRENLNCSRVLESVDFVLEKGGKTIARTSLTYPKDFRRNERGDYIARAPVVLEH